MEKRGETQSVYNIFFFFMGRAAIFNFFFVCVEGPFFFLYLSGGEKKKKRTKGISHKLAYDLSPAIRHTKRKRKKTRERDSVVPCWCNHRHKVSMSKRGLQHELEKKGPAAP